MNLPDTHLDLGCGKFPRNPYRRQQLCGVDIRALESVDGFEFKAANLALEAIPYEDNKFGSVSAFDFIEHMPRILASASGRDTFFPFIRLMNEAWRVLAPGGLLYAVTPAWPSPEAFTDPTHVNVITCNTHEYFCGDNPLGRMYGFTGRFRLRRAEWVRLQESFEATPGAQAAALARKSKHVGLPSRLAKRLRQGIRYLRGRPRETKERLVYFLWELEAVKETETVG